MSMQLNRGFRLSALTSAVLVAALGLSACGSDSNNNDDTPVVTPPTVQKSFSSTGVTAPMTDTERRDVRADQTIDVDGQKKIASYVTILRSGQAAGTDANNIFGRLIDNQKLAIQNTDGSQIIADSNDFSSLLPVGKKLFAVSQFESQPGAMYLTELSQDADTGTLKAVSTKALDLSSINGIWNPCAGMVTPWNTHLGSEEYEPDAKKGVDSAKSMAPFFGGGTTIGGDATKVNPYFYGFPVEVKVADEAGTASVAKHYSMGRMAHELSYVMPDKKTVYQSDDGTNVGFFMYVADTAADLSAGTLYALKWNQTSAAGASDLGTADISWVKLGHAKDSDIKAIIDSGITFADIFDATAPNSDGSCPDGFKSVNANGVGEECLALKSGKETAAAFLETRRYAGYLGATTELRKEEGITFDPDGKRLYVSYSEIQYGMEDNKKNNAAKTSYDIGTSNDVKLLWNSCGGVYGYDVAADSTVGSDYVLKKASGIVAGRMTTLADASKANPSTIDKYADESPFAGSTCDIDGLANPDNLSFVPGEKTLLIGEDTGDGHRNDAVWAYNIESKTLTRLATTPYGAETTSLYHYPNINNFGYIITVVQHPYGESDGDKLADPADKHSYFGYIGPLAAPKQ